MTKTIWLDCDPGHDDVMAIMLAVVSEEINLLGISTVAGNHSLENVTRNALRTLAAIGADDVPVVAGAAQPLLREARVCEEIHGETGLDGTDALEADCVNHLKALDAKAIQVMADAILGEKEGTVTLVLTGAQTNAALLLSVFPEVKEHLKEIVFMGGAVAGGNTGPVAEWNIEIDPEAAAIVLKSGVPVTMVPIDLTHTTLVTDETFDWLRGKNTEFCTMVADVLEFFKVAYKLQEDFDNPPLHDCNTVMYVAYPDIYGSRFVNVEVEMGSQLSFGQTVTDLRCTTGREPNCTVVLEADVPRFLDVMKQVWEECDKRSPLNKQSGASSSSNDDPSA